MMLGRVSEMREATVRISILGRGGQPVEIDAILDTGFNDELTMPSALIAELALASEAPAEATLAGNIRVQTQYFRGTVDWDGSRRTVSVLEIEGVPLIGMSLIWQHRLTLDAVDDGVVRIEPITEA